MLNFTSENKVIWILGKIGQFVLLNFLVLLGCIPIVTIGGIAQRRGTLYEKNERAGGRYFDFRVFPCLCR